MFKCGSYICGWLDMRFQTFQLESFGANSWDCSMFTQWEGMSISHQPEFQSLSICEKYSNYWFARTWTVAAAPNQKSWKRRQCGLSWFNWLQNFSSQLISCQFGIPWYSCKVIQPIQLATGKLWFSPLISSKFPVCPGAAPLMWFDQPWAVNHPPEKIINHWQNS